MNRSNFPLLSFFLTVLLPFGSSSKNVEQITASAFARHSTEKTIQHAEEHQDAPAAYRPANYQPGLHIIPLTDSTFSRIQKAVDDIWLVDTHEHLITEEGRMRMNTGLFYLMGGYFLGDLQSSGISQEELHFVLNGRTPLGERWKTFQVYWEKTKNTAYAHCIRIAARDLFGVEDINEKTYRILDEKLRASNHKGWYQYVLKEKSRIDVSIIDPLSAYIKPDDKYSAAYFLKVKRFDPFIIAGKDEIDDIEAQHGVQINGLRDYLNIFDSAFKKAVFEEHVVGVKTTIAYERSLYFEDVPLSTAENVFRRVYHDSADVTPGEKKSLQDFMMHHLIQLAIEHDLPIQVHTGMLSQTWRENPIQNTDAALLTNLFFKYRRARFVIFHGNYPYMGELAYLAKSFPNVYIDMCWMHIISPAASKRFLEEWLLTVPANKIMAFGGDILKSVEWVYGHSRMARNTVIEVLTKMVKDGYYSEEEAVSIAKMILRTNALELYNIRKSGDDFSGGHE